MRYSLRLIKNILFRNDLVLLTCSLGACDPTAMTISDSSASSQSPEFPLPQTEGPPIILL